jgi:transcriptional regulator with XRE-family HTH domain
VALFFDQDWFDQRLAATGSTRDDVARLLSLSRIQVDELWKDQRELSADNVMLLARFLNVAPEVVANRAGVSTPVPKRERQTGDEVQALRARVERLEAQLVSLQARLETLEPSDRG